MIYYGFDCQWGMNYLGFWDKVLTLLFSWKSLFIDSNEITSIPTEIGELTNLQELYLCKQTYDEFAVIADVDCQWRMNSLGFCDEVLTLLFSCKSLILDGNVITLIPTEIGELTNLQELRLCKQTYDEFAVIADVDCQWRMNSLGFCDELLTLLFSCKSPIIDGNVITSIPTEVGKLTNLKQLHLGKWSWWLCNDLLGFLIVNDYWVLVVFVTRC